MKQDDDEDFDQLMNLMDRLDFGKNEPIDEHYLDSVPLFMEDDKLPENWGDIENIVAIKQLQQEETPEQKCENFKNNGNACMLKGKQKDLKEAVVFYTKAVEEKSSDKKVLSLVYSNRAMAHLKLENYGNCMKDSKRAIICDPTNVKAAWRGAKASIKLKKFRFAMDFIYDGLKNGENKELFDLKKQLNLEMKKEREKENKRKNEEMQIQMEEKKLNDALRKRHLARGKDIFNTRKMYKEVPVYDEESDTINWPVLFIYPAYEKSDYIQSYDENDNLLGIMETFFAPEAERLDFDKKNVLTYKNIKNLRVFVQTNAESRIKNQKFVSLDVNLPLKQVLSLEEYTIPFIPVFYVLDNSQIEEFLSKYDI